MYLCVTLFKRPHVKSQRLMKNATVATANRKVIFRIEDRFHTPVEIDITEYWSQTRNSVVEFEFNTEMHNFRARCIAGNIDVTCQGMDGRWYKHTGPKEVVEVIGESQKRVFWRPCRSEMTRSQEWLLAKEIEMVSSGQWKDDFQFHSKGSEFTAAVSRNSKAPKVRNLSPYTRASQCCDLADINSGLNELRAYFNACYAAGVEPKPTAQKRLAKLMAKGDKMIGM